MTDEYCLMSSQSNKLKQLGYVFYKQYYSFLCSGG
jgi:hypothetical protein